METLSMNTKAMFAVFSVILPSFFMTPSQARAEDEKAAPKKEVEVSRVAKHTKGMKHAVRIKKQEKAKETTQPVPAEAAPNQ